MIQDQAHLQICKHSAEIRAWFDDKKQNLHFPFYASFDIRDSGKKIVPVDANMFPAGFNNICQVDRDNAPDLVRSYLQENYPQVKNIAVISEEHTHNPFYWQNVYALSKAIRDADYNVSVVFPNPSSPTSVETINGNTVELSPFRILENKLIINDSEVDLIISNNDFSVIYSDFESLATPMVPSYKMGWHKRSKETFFTNYNAYAKEFAELLEMDPWSFQVKTEVFEHFDVNSEDSKSKLANSVGEFLSSLKANGNHQVEDPFVFIKNSAGTYGLGILSAKSPEDVLSWNYKSKKKMKATKGGGIISKLILQEGVPTRFVSENETAEPTIYMIGKNLVGGFLRAHNKKGPDENLNSPGAIFKRLCVSDLAVKMSDCPMENVYGWVSKIGVLAIAKEMND